MKRKFISFTAFIIVLAMTVCNMGVHAELTDYNIIINAETLPLIYSDTQDTKFSQSDIINFYSGYSQNESGPEYIYKFTLTEKANLSAELSGMGYGTDIDLHLMKGDSEGELTIINGIAQNVLIRHNSSINCAVDPGVYYLVADTYYSTYGGEKFGQYTLSVNLAPIPSSATIEIDASVLPVKFSDTRNTKLSQNDNINSYLGHSQNESGPEYLYKFTLLEECTVNAVLSGMSYGTDIDVHIIKADESGKPVVINGVAQNVKARGSLSLQKVLDPGTYYVVSDTCLNYAGIYTIDISISPYVIGAGTLYEDMMQTSSTLTDAEVKPAIEAIANRLNGLSGHELNDYLSVVCPPDYIDASMASMSGCGLTAAFVWRCLGVGDREIWNKYVVGSAIVNVINIAKRYSAWRTTQNKDIYFGIGDVVYVSSPEHVLIVSSEVTKVNDTTLSFYAINGGGLTFDGKQLISNCEMKAQFVSGKWKITRPGVWTRDMYGWAETTKLPRTEKAHLPQ